MATFRTFSVLITSRSASQFSRDIGRHISYFRQASVMCGRSIRSRKRTKQNVNPPSTYESCTDMLSVRVNNSSLQGFLLFVKWNRFRLSLVHHFLPNVFGE